MEKGERNVHMMADAPIAPFFRFPDLRYLPEMDDLSGGGAQHRSRPRPTSYSILDFKIKEARTPLRSP